MNSEPEIDDFEVDHGLVRKLREEDDILYKEFIWFIIISKLCNTLTNLLRLNRCIKTEKCDDLLEFIATITLAYINEVSVTFANLWMNYSDVIQHLKEKSPTKELADNLTMSKTLHSNIYNNILNKSRNSAFHFCSKKDDFDQADELYLSYAEKYHEKCETMSIQNSDEDHQVYINGFPMKIWGEAMEHVINENDVNKARTTNDNSSMPDILKVTANDTYLEVMIKKLFSSTYSDVIPICQGVLELLLCTLITAGILKISQ